MPKQINGMWHSFRWQNFVRFRRHQPQERHGSLFSPSVRWSRSLIKLKFLCSSNGRFSMPGVVWGETRSSAISLSGKQSWNRNVNHQQRQRQLARFLTLGDAMSVSVRASMRNNIPDMQEKNRRINEVVKLLSLIWEVPNVYLSSVCATHPPEHPSIPAMGCDIPANSRRPNPLTTGKRSDWVLSVHPSSRINYLIGERSSIEAGKKKKIPSHFPPQKYPSYCPNNAPNTSPPPS